jgi:hypothetical protein
MIRTQEVLQRPMSIQTKTLMSIDFFPPEGTQGAKGPMGPVKKDPCKFRTLLPPPQVPGHTGYLTFATFVPKKEMAQSSIPLTNESYCQNHEAITSTSSVSCST